MPRPDRATFRLPAAALFLPALLFFCIAPLATSGGAWAVLFVVPVIALAWLIVTRTTATPERVTAHGLLGSRRMAWTELDGLEFTASRWAIAVGLDGRRLRLPMVRPRDLPRLAAVSGGSLHLGSADADSPGAALPTEDGISPAENAVPTGDDAVPTEAPGGQAGTAESGPTSPASSEPTPATQPATRSPVPAGDIES